MENSNDDDIYGSDTEASEESGGATSLGHSPTDQDSGLQSRKRKLEESSDVSSESSKDQGGPVLQRTFQMDRIQGIINGAGRGFSLIGKIGEGMCHSLAYDVGQAPDINSRSIFNCLQS